MSFVTERFRRAVDHLFALEGGYVNDPKDKGGETKYGISKRSYPLVSIATLTKDDAVQIYHRDFWCPLRLDELRSEKVARVAFEFGVHAGVTRSAKALQSAVNAAGRPLSVDGHVGPATVAMVNRVGEEAMLSLLRREILAHYDGIVRRDASQSRFLRGWRNRLEASAS